MQVKVVLSLVVEYFVQFIFCQMSLLLETHTTTMKSRLKYIGCSKKAAKKSESSIWPKKVVFWDTFSGFCTLAAPPETSPKMAARRPGGREELGQKEGGGGFRDKTPLLCLVRIPLVVLGFFSLSGSWNG